MRKRSNTMQEEVVCVGSLKKVVVRVERIRVEVVGGLWEVFYQPPWSVKREELRRNNS